METESDEVKIWKLKIKAFAIAAVTTLVAVALWQGHNGVALAAGVGAVCGIAGVKVTNGILGKVKH